MMNKRKSSGRKQIQLEPKEIAKINMLYWVNQNNYTNIARMLGRGVTTIERVIFTTRAEYDDWYLEMIAKDLI